MYLLVVVGMFALIFGLGYLIAYILISFINAWIKEDE